MSTSWFALQVRVRMELKAAAMLRAKGYEEFLPLHRSPQCDSDPLFVGYVFSRISPEACGRFVTTPSVIQVVSFVGKRAPVNPEEIAPLQLIKESKCAATAMEGLHDGDRITIEDGQFRNVSGTLRRFEDNTGY